MKLERLEIGGREIVLLGTAHVSKKSVEEVRQAIEEEKPDVVGVELDIQRLRQLRQGEKWLNTDIGKVISSGQTYLFLLTLLLSNIQRSLGQKLDIKPGAEMIEAIKIAEEKSIPVMLLDRDVNVTLRRAIQKTSLIEKLKLASSIMFGLFAGEEKIPITETGIEQLKEKDILNQLMQQMAKETPSLKSVLVDERDAYIAQSITASPGKKILAVVGAGHMEGVKSLIGKKLDIKSMSTAEKGLDFVKIIQYTIPALFVAITAGLFLMKGVALTATALVYWFLATGTLAALGTLLARGHPFSVLAAFLAAPFTTLHPLLAAGWIAGYVEARIRNPKVKDFEELKNLNSLRDFTQNQVTRILMVVALANIGATLGVVIAFPWILSLFG